MLAASFGVIMAHQLPNPEFARALRVFLTGLRDALTGATATSPTNHWLARLYVQGSVTLARTYHNSAVPDGLGLGGRVPFAAGPSVEPIAANDPRAGRVEHTIDMHFENYTIGRLIEGRRNYDMDHPAHRAALAYVRGTVWAHGWPDRPFASIDNLIANSRYHEPTGIVERYGTKYDWIGFYTYAGRLADTGQLPSDERLPDVGIDPSFPEPLPRAPVSLPTWARRTPKNDKAWLRGGVIPVPDELLYRSEVGGEAGPWVAVAADLDTEDEAVGRKVFGCLTALLAPTRHAKRLVDALAGRTASDWWWITEAPDDHYTFAGEIPWSPEFSRTTSEDSSGSPYRKLVSVEGGPDVDVEILSHVFAWESSYHSPLNAAGRNLVPSREFSRAFDLRGSPQSFGQRERNGSWAAISCSAPAGFDGRILYLREDLVFRYASGRRLIWLIWGERQLDIGYRDAPQWMNDIRVAGQDMWSLVRRGEDLCTRFASATLRKTRRSGLHPPPPH